MHAHKNIQNIQTSLKALTLDLHLCTDLKAETLNLFEPSLDRESNQMRHIYICMSMCRRARPDGPHKLDVSISRNASVHVAGWLVVSVMMTISCHSEYMQCADPLCGQVVSVHA